MNQTETQYAVETFGIKADEFIWYNSGICYDRIGVTTKEAAEKVSEVVKAQDRTANGGMFHGMPLGVISTYKDDNGVLRYDVTC